MPSGRLATLVLIALIAPAGHAYGQRAEGEAEFQRGRSLMAEGKYARACKAFEASMKLDPQKGTLYNLGLCHEKAGKLATAWSELIELSRTDTNPARAKDAARRAAALESRLTRMRLVLAEKLDGQTVVRDGLDVTALHGSDAPVDPGRYTFEATAPGREPYSIAVELSEEGKTIEVRIPRLKKSTASRDDAPGGEPPAGIEPEPASYPRDLPHRPILIPHGGGEVSGDLSAGADDGYERTAFYAGARARARLGPFEARIATGFILRAPATMNRPNPWDAIGLGLRYPIGPELVVGLDYTQRQPLRAERRGSDLAANVERKLLILPRVAVDGTGGVVFAQREAPGNAFTLYGEGKVQFGIDGGWSLQAYARLDLHLLGDLYDYTVGIDVAALAVYAVAPNLDLFAQASNSLLPGASLHTYLLGASWRIRGG
jgi:hypothetical protein